MAIEERETDSERRESALAIIEGQFTQIARDPDLIIRDGERAAKALNAVMDRKPLKERVMMNNERYLEFEDWSLVTTFFGRAIATPIDETRFIDLGTIEIVPGKPVHVYGYEAVAYLVDIRTGRRTDISASMTCLTDEPKWREKNKYEWVDDTPEAIAGRPVDRRSTFEDKGERRKRAKVLIGTDPVPLFQLRSMAQTRAGSKVARLNYSWVAVLGGHSPTPAEEVAEQGPPDNGDPVKTEQLEPISKAWKMLVDAEDPAAKKTIDDVKKVLRGLGYRGTAAKDLWADFASRGADDVQAIRIAIGIEKPPEFEEPKNGNGKKTEALFPEEKK
jgi:hypothetical protein